jgi:hypothetical protein
MMVRLGLLLLAGAGLLIGFYYYARWSRQVSPAQSLKLLRWTGVVVGLVLLLVLTARGGSVLTLPLLGALIPALWRWRVLWDGVPGASPQEADDGSTKSSSSRVETLYLRMVLNHATGELKGRILRGRFEGVELRRLQLRDLLLLYRECQSDAQSVAVLEAYLDYVHKGLWREQYAREQQEASWSASEKAMDLREAYEVLGLQPGASLEDIKAAHRRLVQRVHPDQGGSTYLAAKINRAKDLLLGK